jgi:cytochrome o ubiquinol oxidase operon protein cyoD
MRTIDLTATPQQAGRKTLLSYLVGFVLSLLLTLAAYVSVVNHSSMGSMTMAVIAGLAVVQLMVQLLFFMHLGRERRPRFNLLIFMFMLVVVGIVVIGSLWIMRHLDYNMMPEDMNHYMVQQYKAGSF